MPQTLRDWYLARLRSTASMHSGKTPMGLVAHDNEILQLHVLQASKDRSAQKQEYFDALISKGTQSADYLIMAIVFVGIMILLAIALLPA